MIISYYLRNYEFRISTLIFLKTFELSGWVSKSYSSSGGRNILVCSRTCKSNVQSFRYFSLSCLCYGSGIVAEWEVKSRVQLLYLASPAFWLGDLQSTVCVVPGIYGRILPGLSLFCTFFISHRIDCWIQYGNERCRRACTSIKDFADARRLLQDKSKVWSLLSHRGGCRI